MSPVKLRWMEKYEMTVQEKLPAEGVRPLSLAKPSDKRKETRYPTNDAAEVRVLPSDGQNFPATIIDISKSGLRLELSAPLLKGRRIEIMTTARKLVIFGEVRYCRRVGGVFHAGVLIEGVVSPKDSSEAHLLDDEIALFVVGKGLSVPELLRAKDHISKCDSCSRRMTETAATLYPRRLKQTTPW